jgi:succinoglycan biosynthesis protein ExoA
MLSESPSTAAPSIAAASFEAIETLALSIVIPTHGRLASLQQCLASIFAAQLPEATEILVVCNGSDPPTEDFLRALSASEPRLHLMELDIGSPAEARNAALGKVRGEIVYFLDDDVTIAPDLFARALNTFAQRPEVDVIGGPNLTPSKSSQFEQSVGSVLASPFGSARVAARYRSTGHLRLTDDRALILCNLAIRGRAIIGRRPVFESELVCNEENLLLGILERENRSMLHDPELIVYHARRGSLSGFARQIFKYGRGRWQNTLALPASLSPTFLLPSIFLGYLLLLPFLPFPARMIPLAAYGVLLMTFAMYETFRARAMRAFPHFLVLFPICHLAYGAGLMWQFALSALPALGLKARSEPSAG